MVPILHYKSAQFYVPLLKWTVVVEDRLCVSVFRHLSPHLCEGLHLMARTQGPQDKSFHIVFGAQPTREEIGVCTRYNEGGGKVDGQCTGDVLVESAGSSSWWWVSWCAVSLSRVCVEIRETLRVVRCVWGTRVAKYFSLGCAGVVRGPQGSG